MQVTFTKKDIKTLEDMEKYFMSEELRVEKSDSDMAKFLAGRQSGKAEMIRQILHFIDGYKDIDTIVSESTGPGFKV